MADSEPPIESAFFIAGDDGRLVFAALPDFEDVLVYECADGDTANEVASAINLVWQCIVYGKPNEDDKAEFQELYGHLGYGPGDVTEFIEKMLEIGLIGPSDIMRSVH